MPALVRDFRYRNAMQVPRVEKIVVNIGLGEAIQNGHAIDAAVNDLKTITGQAPIVIRAKKSVAAFKLREGMPIGVKVTLRGRRMWEFLDKVVSVDPAPHPGLPRHRPQGLRRPRQLHARAARAAGLPRDRLRQDRQAARARGLHRHHGPEPTTRAAPSWRRAACPSASRDSNSDRNAARVRDSPGYGVER